jgi:protein-disulfide isomerase
MLFRLALLAAVAIVAVAVAVVLAGPGSDDDQGNERTRTPSAVEPSLRGIPQDGIALGDPDAPVTIVEFADLQCPFCAEFHENVFPELVERHVRDGQVRIELRLLRFLGPDSDRLARAAAAAAGQDRMWQFVDLAYSRQGRENSGYATDQFINELAADAGVTNLDAGARAERLIREGEALARTGGIESTPSFLIGPTGGTLSRYEPQALSFDDFAPRIEGELNR